jgi:glycosyltransferase involved in cell wall biosynthesis
VGKKALFFIEDGSFTYDNRVIRETSALIDAGWSVTVISPKYRKDPFYKYINEHLRAYYYPKPNAESTIGHILEHTISLLFGTLLTFWVFIRHNFKVFHACNPLDILWLIALPYKILGKKFIFDQHDLCPELFLSRAENQEMGMLYRTLLFLEHFSYKFADSVIATNESYKEISIRRGGKKANEVFVVRNGPDLDKFHSVAPNKELTLKGSTLVGYLGNMNLPDGVINLLEAAFEIILNRKRRDISFIFIGGGPQQGELANLSSKKDLDDYILFTGRIPDDEMLSNLCACDICVQPDPNNPLNDKSTMNKVMEYMALEKPVVAFDLKESRVSCGDAALYAKPNEVSDLAKKILDLADDSSLRERKGKLGRERIVNEFAWNYSIPNLLSAYEHAVTR